LAFSYWTIKPWFLSEGKLLLCSSYLPLGVPNWSVIYINTGAMNYLQAVQILGGTRATAMQSLQLHLTGAALYPTIPLEVGENWRVNLQEIFV
jgi:hypothetical protein